MSALAWRPASDPPWPTGYQGVGWTSGWLARRSSLMSRPRVACHRLSPPGSGGAYSAWSARKARQLRWAKRHNAGRYSKRLRRSINEIAKLRARQARRRADFTHKFTTDVAKRHGEPSSTTRRASVGASLRTRRVDSAQNCGWWLQRETSQTCAACGHRDPASRPGCGRVFACTDCGYQAHADANAARNIEALAAGQAVNRTRSHPRVARPSSRMREPLGSVA